MSFRSEAKVRASMPRIGDAAPLFQAKSTHGDLYLSDYRGEWVLLFSHPADFTPVCTTEFIALAKRYDDFKQRNVQLIGLSIDSLSAHLAWVRNIEEKMGVTIPFPVIADLTGEVAQQYGMIHAQASDTATVRCVFLIDDRQTVRAVIYYPLNVGRNVDELLRLIDALQTVDAYSVATPANWHPGDKIVEPAPLTVAALNERLATCDLEGSDWYLQRRQL
ncbi:peroxiredoxin [Numidum massiliense]|uniref:peroxiredoxin n=1 Tax=Numidum massiliense TaxID=1522315 RepID=UPI0006D5B680|nr:peroxiredoxin [Numidum massiliense]